MKTIDLGKSNGCCEIAPKSASDSKKFYPSIYVSDVKEIDFPDGEFEFKAKARVTRKTEDLKNDKYSYDIEIISIADEFGEDNSIEDAIDKVAAKKMKRESKED